MKWQQTKTLSRTNNDASLSNHIKENIDEYREQVNNWYKLFEYSYERKLFNLF